MDNKLQFDGGEPDVRLDQILFGSELDNRAAIFGLSQAYYERLGLNFTISGCVVTVGGSAPTNTWSMTTGFIWLNTEILLVEAQSGTFDSDTEFLAFDKTITYRADGNKTFIDATPRQTLQQNRGTITVQGSVSGTELDAISGDRYSEVFDFKRDVISAQQITMTADFSAGEDLIRLSIGSIPSATDIVISGIVDGDDTKYLEIFSTTQEDVNFTNATDISVHGKTFLAGETVIYRIWKKNGNQFVSALKNPSLDWQTPSYNANFTAGTNPLEYRLSYGKLEMRGDMASTVTSGIAFVLPIGYRPDYIAHTIFLSAALIVSATITIDGEVFGSWNSVGNNSFNSVIILD